jgi:hypothetical protein
MTDAIQSLMLLVQDIAKKSGPLPPHVVVRSIRYSLACSTYGDRAKYRAGLELYDSCSMTKQRSLIRRALKKAP